MPTLTTRYSVISSRTLHGQLGIDRTDPGGQGRLVSTGGQKRGTFEPETTKQGTARGRGKAGTEGTMSGCKGLEARRMVS